MKNIYKEISDIRHDMIKLASAIKGETERHDEKLKKLLISLQEEALKVTSLVESFGDDVGRTFYTGKVAFRRLKDGAVQVLRFSKIRRAYIPLETIDRDSWCSVIGSMSKCGDTAEIFSFVEKLHDGKLEKGGSDA